MLRNAEDVCAEYALAAEAVREQTRIMRNNRCEEESKPEITANGYGAPAVESCLSQHWTIETDVRGSEHPMKDSGDMCDPCQIRLKAFEARKDAKRRLGAVKRSIESVGKRINRNSTATK